MDRHEHLGAGRIGPVGLGTMLRDPRLRETTFIMETPGADEGWDAVNMRRAWMLWGGATELPVSPRRHSTRTGARRGSFACNSSVTRRPSSDVDGWGPASSEPQPLDQRRRTTTYATDATDRISRPIGSASALCAVDVSVDTEVSGRTGAAVGVGVARSGLSRPVRSLAGSGSVRRGRRRRRGWRRGRRRGRRSGFGVGCLHSAPLAAAAAVFAVSFCHRTCSVAPDRSVTKSCEPALPKFTVHLLLKSEFQLSWMK